MTSIIEQIPGMSDDQLSNLRRNAARLAGGGTAAGRTAAEVLDAVDAAIATRATTRKAELAERRAAAPRPKRTRRVAAAD